MDLLDFSTGTLQADDFESGEPINQSDFVLFVNTKAGVAVRSTTFVSEDEIEEMVERLRASRYATSTSTSSYFYYWKDSTWLGPGSGEGFKEPSNAEAIANTEFVSKIASRSAS